MIISLAVEKFGMMPTEFMERYGHYPAGAIEEVRAYFDMVYQDREAARRKAEIQADTGTPRRGRGNLRRK